MSELLNTARFTVALHVWYVRGPVPAAWERRGAGRLAAACVALLLLLLSGAPAAAQHGWGSVNGRVVDAENLRPLHGAWVELEVVASDDGAQAGRVRTAVTDSVGEYRFDGVGPGLYRLYVRRIGFMANSVEVDLRQVPSARLSLGLEVSPVVLPPLRVLGSQVQPYAHFDGRQEDEANGGRADLARMRQMRYVAGDVVQLSQAEVEEAVTLAETDVFRALQRTPGVSTRDDYTATLWTRGATWDQTRVYFDGLPLFNPTHAGWLFSAINPDALGSVAFYPGVRSAEWGEGGAAVLDLRSRTGGENGAAVQGKGEISLASARLALDGQILNGRLGWMVAARRTYVDILTGALGALTGDAADFIPYDFSDVVGRVDGRIGGGWGYSASAIFEQDRLRGDVRGLLRGNHGQWGNRSGQVAVQLPLGPLQGRVSAGETRFRAAILQRRPTTLRRDPTLPPLESTIEHHALSVEVGPRRGARNWSAGYQMLRDTVSYDGPFSLLGELAVVLPRDNTAGNPYRYGSELGYHVLWAQHRLDLGTRLSIDTGLRLEMGDSLVNGGRRRTGPRLAVRWHTPEGTQLSAGWARSFQYTQDIAPVAGPLGPQLHLTHLWVLAQSAGGYPVLRSDIATAGLERWFGQEWLVGGTVYRRYATGVEFPNPREGRVVLDRDPDVVATNLARGAELSVRRLVGRWTGSIGYAFGDSRMHVLDVVVGDSLDRVYPSSADVRHALDATAMVRLRGGVRIGGAYTYGSGVPFTRLILPRADDMDAPVRLGEANQDRTRSYASLDLTADYTRRWRSWQVTGYVQVRNALNRDNTVTYAGSRACTVGVAEIRGAADACGDGRTAVDRFEPGIPRLPLVGLRFSF